MRKSYFPSLDLDSEATLKLGNALADWTFLPEKLDENAVIYSFGVGEDISFDLALIARCGVHVHAFDPTPRVLQWINEQQVPEQFTVHPLALSNEDGEATFIAPENPKHISHRIGDQDGTDERNIRVKTARLQSIMGSLGHQRIDLLKMDVEGAEYAVIDDLVQGGPLPTQLLVEFHHRFDDSSLKDTIDAVAKLRGAGYQLFDVSPSGEEFSFLYSKP